MSQLVLQKKTESLSPIQKTFQRLQKKILQLQKKLESRFQELDAGLVFYKDKIWPIEKELIQVLQELILHLHAYFKKLQNFSKKERMSLKELILHKIDHLFSLIPPSEADEKVRLIFKELEGISCEEVVADQFDQAKREIREMFSENGIELDLSHINTADKESVVIKKMVEALRQAAESSEQTCPPKPKSKKQVEKEQKARELKELQEKGLGSIYKQLAKLFHPDLERDPKLKAEKEEFMKKLTAAYERGDLHTLLSLQVKWMNRTEGEDPCNPDGQLRIYNTILKDQIKELEERIKTVHFDPKYFSLQHYLEFGDDNCGFILYSAYRELIEDICAHKDANTKLCSHKNDSYVRHLIQTFTHTTRHLA